MFLILVSFLSKIALDPLIDYVNNLQALSKETLHELNIPISTIKMNSQMIKKQLNDVKSLKRLNRIDTACEMLQLRYNELDYMIRTQSMQEIKEDFDLAVLLQERIEFLRPIYTQVIFNLDLESTQLFNDKRGLSKVIDNLIDNAVKYSPNSNKIDIYLRNNELHIQDYGKGMDEVELLHMFNEYYQGNENIKGFGIGLSLVKRFCDKRGIHLKIESQKDVGTSVKLNFKQ
ncbi:MAG: HAMP domain-containing sensor histidine kinase [Sulfurimonas sp.]|nr:HAMP domain-containing sensor histidine kinase [Sulfurimonas sp.]